MASDTSDGFTVKDLARRWKIGPGKVRSFLRRGELVGVNVSDSPAKTQWRITSASVDAFERRRSSAPLPRPIRRQRTAEVDYFPDEE